MTTIHFNIAIIVILVILWEGAISWESSERQGQEGGFGMELYESSCSRSSVVDVNQIQLGNCDKKYYTMSMMVGTPPQSMQFVLDSSQNNIILQAKTQQHEGFEQSSSTSLQTTDTSYEINIFNSTITVNQTYDIIMFGSSQINIKNSILITNQQINDLLNNNTVFGVLGLAMQQNRQNFVFNSFSSQQLQTSAYTFSLRNDDQPSYFYMNQVPSQIIANSINISSADGSVSSLQVLQFSSILNDQQKKSREVETAIISSTTQYFAIRESIYNYITQKYFSKCLFLLTGAQCSCEIDQWPTFTVMFIGVELYIPPSSYIIYQSNQICTFGFDMVPDNSFYDISLGTSIFHNYNITFNIDQQTIGFQGNMTQVYLVNCSQFFVTSLYLMSIPMLIFTAAGCFLVWFVKVERKEDSTSRFVEISLSTRFLDTS